MLDFFFSVKTYFSIPECHEAFTNTFFGIIFYSDKISSLLITLYVQSQFGYYMK